jgi:hypothetical protein
MDSEGRGLLPVWQNKARLITRGQLTLMHGHTNRFIDMAECAVGFWAADTVSFVGRLELHSSNIYCYPRHRHAPFLAGHAPQPAER